MSVSVQLFAPMDIYKAKICKALVLFLILCHTKMIFSVIYIMSCFYDKHFHLYIACFVLYSMSFVIFPGICNIPWRLLYSLAFVIFPGFCYIPWRLLYSLAFVIFPGICYIPWHLLSFSSMTTRWTAGRRWSI